MSLFFLAQRKDWFGVFGLLHGREQSEAQQKPWKKTEGKKMNKSTETVEDMRCPFVLQSGLVPPRHGAYDKLVKARNPPSVGVWGQYL